MPIYEYACTTCGHKTDILHGIHETGPHFCPECGAEGTMRKGFAPPAIVFKGSGWAKKDRGAATRTKAAAKGGDAEAKPAASVSGGDSSSGESASGSSASGSSASGSSASSSGTSSASGGGSSSTGGAGSD